MDTEAEPLAPAWGEALAEKRAAGRVRKVLFARVHGAYGAYKAMLSDISSTGALLSITDRAFESVEPGDLGLAGLRIASHFGEGLRIELLDEAVTLEADVARISEEQRGERCVLWLGCHFREPLAPRTCAALGLDAPPDYVVPEGPEVDPRLRIETSFNAVPGGSIDAVRGRAPGGERPGCVRVTEDGPLVGIRDLLQDTVQRGASDLHVKAGSPVRMRIDGELREIGDRALLPAEAEALVRELLNAEQYARFQEIGDLALGYALEGQGRFRVNVLRTQRMAGLAARRIPGVVPTAEELGLSPLCVELAARPRGLVLVTGPAGSGKSTTLAAMLDHVNRTRACHIVTLEDPIEFLHREQRAHVTQREIGTDTGDFAAALAGALRQDPDVLLVGELRDAGTMALAVAAAESGRLVLAALPTTSAPLTVDRIVDVFPPDRQRPARKQLADALQGVVCQALLPKVGGGLVVAQEILVATAPVRALVREGRAAQIGNLMQAGGKAGMQTFEDALRDLVQRGLVTPEMARQRANHPELLDAPDRPRRS